MKTEILDWPLVTLGEVAEDVTVGFVGPMTKEYRQSGVPFLRSKNVKPFSILLDDIRYISTHFHHKLAKSHLSPGDIVIVRTGVPGLAAVIPDWLEEANCADLVIVRPGRELNSRYFAYYMNSLAVRHVEAYTVGAVQQHFNVKSAKQLRFRLPPLREQQEIVEILSGLDDKIELNRQMNHTLEQMARALFKSWFVDFDPVAAKAAGKKPFGMTDEIAALFPDRFVDSELGPIPEGWRPGDLGDLAENHREVINPGSLNDNVPYIGLEHMPRRSISLWDWGFSSEVTSHKYVFDTGDILFGKLRPYFHKVGVAPVSGLCSTDVLVIRPVEKEYYSLTLITVSSTDFIDYADAGSTGTKMPRTSWKDMARYAVAIPPKELANFSDKIVRGLVETMLANIHEKTTLIEIRDLLLPKLLSGELRINQAEKIVAEAV